MQLQGFEGTFLYRFQKDMKKILKHTPITFNGVDGWEVMVLDDDLRHGGVVGCDKCMYDYNEISQREDVPCPTITGCWYDDRTYFEFRTEPVKQ